MAVSILGSGATPVTGTREFDPIPGGVPGGGGSVNISAGDSNDYVITSTGVGDDIQGESNLQFDGTTLSVTGAISLTGGLTATGLGSTSIATLCTYNTSSGQIGYNAPSTTTGTTYLRDNGTWGTPTGAGDVSKVGTPANDQLAVWTGDGTLEGDQYITTNATTLVLANSKDLQLTSGDIYVAAMQAYSSGNTSVVHWDNALGQLQHIDSGGGTSNFLRADGQWAAPGGVVTASGPPSSNQITTWTSATNITGTSNLTFDESTLDLTGDFVITTGDITVQNMSAASTVNVLNYNTSSGLVTYNASGGGTTNFLRADGTWTAPPGSDVSKTGSPSDNQLAIWTAVSGQLEGDSGLTYDGTSMSISGDVTMGGLFITSTSNSQLVNDGSTYEISIRGSFNGTSSKIWENDGNAGIQGYNELSYSDTSGSAAFYVEGDASVMNAYTGAAWKTFQIDSNYSMSGMPTYADNTAAKSGGLSDNDLYRTSTGVLMIVYT